MSSDKQPITIKNVAQGCLGCLGMLAVVAVGLWILIPDPDPATLAERAENDKKRSAYVACQQFTEDRLKSPGSADWPFVSSAESTALVTGNKYRVRTYVDAQNGFGAVLRTQVDCVVHMISTDNWALDSLSLE